MRRGSDAPTTAVETMVGRGSNSVVVRRYNAQLILAGLRRLGEASKADLARYTNLTQNTVGLIVETLLADGLVCASGRRAGGRGQPSTLLTLAPNGVWSIGVRIGRSNLSAVRVDFCGAVLDTMSQSRPLPDPAAALEETLAAITAIRGAGRGRAGRLAGVGIAMPFDLDRWRDDLDGGSDRAETDHLDAWRGVDFTSTLRERLDLPVFAENDGTAAAVAELFCGHGRDLGDFVSLTIASAIGGGVVLDGRYRRGATGNAGDIGLMPIASCAEIAGDAAEGFGLLLGRASLAALRRRLAAAGTAAGPSLDAAIAANPRVVAAWLEDCAQTLTQPLLSIGAILDLDAITIDGDLEPALIARLIDRVRELTAAAAPEARSPPRVLQGRIGRDAAAIGAAILPLHHNFTPDQRLLGAAA